MRFYIPARDSGHANHVVQNNGTTRLFQTVVVDPDDTIWIVDPETKLLSSPKHLVEDDVALIRTLVSNVRTGSSCIRNGFVVPVRSFG